MGTDFILPIFAFCLALQPLLKNFWKDTTKCLTRCEQRSTNTRIWKCETQNKDTMIDVSKENLIDFAEAARMLPRRASGKTVHTRTVARWALAGVGGIVLESIRIGGCRVTSREACQRFYDLLTIQNENRRRPHNGKPSAGTRDALAAKGLM